jgi:hypothetical protein
MLISKEEARKRQASTRVLNFLIRSCGQDALCRHVRRKPNTNVVVVLDRESKTVSFRWLKQEDVESLMAGTFQQKNKGNLSKTTTQNKVLGSLNKDLFRVNSAYYRGLTQPSNILRFF